MQQTFSQVCLGSYIVAYNEDNHLPILNAVVESGNESIIQSSRLGQQVLRELESLRTDPPGSTQLDSHHSAQQAIDAVALQPVENNLSADLLADKKIANVDSQVNSANELQDVISFNLDNRDDNDENEFEWLIDELVDRHITELRKDIKQLLERAKSIS